ncbi:SixA phosphatase family protein [Loktanella agnita]|uniref:SixA phosphatase family protein n=1 Tax=Loktanella agnita TaxID=287097 RepID=UPI003989BFEA
MSLRLILIRHAKSGWNDPGADDHARVLNQRGHESAIAIGEWLAKQGYMPELILCSDATRTQETAALIIPHLHPQPRLQLSSALYHAAPDTILDLIRRSEAASIAVVGHNPGIGMLARGLVETAPDHARFGDYPTCATTVLDFDADRWNAIQPYQGRIVDFIVPRDLIGTRTPVK